MAATGEKYTTFSTSYETYRENAEIIAEFTSHVQRKWDSADTEAIAIGGVRYFNRVDWVCQTSACNTKEPGTDDTVWITKRQQVNPSKEQAIAPVSMITDAETVKSSNAKAVAVDQGFLAAWRKTMQASCVKDWVPGYYGWQSICLEVPGWSSASTTDIRDDILLLDNYLPPGNSNSSRGPTLPSSADGLFNINHIKSGQMNPKAW